MSFSLAHGSRSRKLGIYIPAIALVVCTLSYLFVIRPLFAVSATVSITTQADWQAGESWNNSLDTTTTVGDLKLKAGAGLTWDTSTPGFPENVRGNWNITSQTPGIGADLTNDGSYIYMTLGNRNPDFFRYNPDTNTWKRLADAPTDFYYNGAITYYNGYVYAINGHDGTTSTDAGSEFWRYDIANDSWSKMADAPGQWGSTSAGGGDIESGNNGKLYAVQGSGLESFWIYNTATNAWSVGASPPDPISQNNSHPLVYSNVSYDLSGVTQCANGCIYSAIGNGSQSFYRYDINLEGWFVAANTGANGTMTAGDALVLDDVNHVIYGFRGTASSEFQKYTPGAVDTWDQTYPQDAQKTTSSGSALTALRTVVGGNPVTYIYALFGGVGELARYDTSMKTAPFTTGAWDSMLVTSSGSTNENMMVFVPNGSDCADADGCLYLNQPGSTTMKRFLLRARAWDATFTVVLPAVTSIGGSMCYDGNGQLFIEQGNSQNVYPININTSTAPNGSQGTTQVIAGATGSGSAITCFGDNRYYVLRAASQPNMYQGNNGTMTTDDSINTNGLTYTTASYGAAMTTNGTYLYALIGNGRGNFLQFNPAASAGSRWTELPNLPTTTSLSTQGYTSVLEYDGTDYIYAVPGLYQTDAWRYSIRNQTWSRVPDVPVRVAGGMGLAKGAATSSGGKLYFQRGLGPTGIYRATFSTGSSGTNGTYAPSATWVSAPVDMNYVSQFNSFSSDTTTPTNTAIAFQTRTSSNKVDWSAWADLNAGNIASPANRYIQVKAVLSSTDGASTPTLSSFTINYEKDATAPDNPTVSGYSSSAKTTTLTSGSNSKYYYTTPYFEWTAPSQAGASDLAGFYVAWTTNCSFNPSSSEAYFQTANTYQVNNAMSRSGAGTLWCLRMATKDAAGNVSSDQTVFQYTYTGVSGSTANAWAAQNDFNLGTTSNTQTTASPDDGSVTLSPITNTGNTGWTNEAAMPVSTGAGATMTFDGSSNIYIQQGASLTIYVYNITTKTYTQKRPYPGASNFASGGAMVYVPTQTGCSDAGGCIFAMRGGTSTDFQRLDINANTWAAVPPTVLPMASMTGASFAYNGNGVIYYLPGNSSSLAYKYTIATNAWTRLSDLDVGGSANNTMTYVPTGTYCSAPGGCLYVVQGASSHFIKGTINNAGSVSWSYVMNAPGPVYDGGSMIYNNGYIYLLRGNTTTMFARYDVLNNTWTTLESAPGQRYNLGSNSVTVNATTGVIYALRHADSALMTFDISRGSWNTSTPGIPYFSTTSGYNGGITVFDPKGAGTADDVLYVSRGNGYADFWQYGIATKTWTQLTDVPHTFTASSGGDAELVDHTNDTYDGVYVMIGFENFDNLGYFYKYTPTTGMWTRLANLPAKPSAGADLVYDGADSIYTGAGNGTTTFYRYNILTNTWTIMSNAPDSDPIPGILNTGACAVLANVGATKYIYVARGGSSNTLYRYNLSTMAWQSDVAAAPIAIGAPDTCFLDGPNNGTTENILIPQGSTSNTTMYKYSPVSNTWSYTSRTLSLAYTFRSPTYTDVTSKFIAGGVGNYVTMFSAQNDYVYLASDAKFDAAQFNLQVNGVGTFSLTFEYSASADGTTWNTFIPTDGTSGMTASGAITWDPSFFTNGSTSWTPATVNSSAPLYYIRIKRGGASITTAPQSNTVRLISAPLNTPDAFVFGTMVMGANNTLYGFGGNNKTTMERYVVATASTGYQTNGTWTSNIIDFNGGQAAGIYSLGDVEVTDSIADSTSMTIETRTCTDASCTTNPGAWTTVTNKRTVSGVDYYSVGSSVARYGQIRVTMNSDAVLSPTLQDVTWRYYVDNTAPTNPSVPVGGYTDSGKGTAVTNNTWANDLTPYFEWTAADDTNGIGVDGFYVYFGTNATKDPVTDASDPTNLAYRNGPGNDYYTVNADGTTGSWDALTQSSAALTDGVYYLRIKTKDRNGNITASAVDAFTFKVDGSKPNNVSDLSVGTYMSSTDNFQFTWSDVSDVGPSGVSKYCYHTGSSSDTCVAATSLCSGGTCTVSNVAHYQNRVNAFYVRAQDAALNNADSYTSTGYFYTGPAPTVPQSVTVTPTSQTDTDSFGVNWTLPHTCLGQTPCVASDILQYCYTINVVPSEATCGTNTGGNPTPSSDGGWTTSTQTSARALPAFSAATRQGSNTVYIVAKDAIGNIDYANYTSADFTFTSNAPGPPQQLQSTDSSDRASSRYSLTLTWNQPSSPGSGVAGYNVYRCTSNCTNPDALDDPPANYTRIATVGTLGYLDTGLSNSTTYSYFVRAVGSGSTISGNSAVTSMRPEGKFKVAPAISGVPSETVHIRSAQIEWLTQDDVDQQGDTVPHPASSFIQYGTTTGYGSEVGSSTLVNQHSVTLTGLTPNTTYHYRAKWVDVDGNTGYSTDAAFTTMGAPSAPLNVQVDYPTRTINSFTFTWDPPSDEGVTIGGYYYSINSTPTENNTHFTTSRSVGPIAAATRQGMNTFYVVAADDANNVNYANYASVDFEAYTPAPDVPANVKIVDSSDRATHRFLLTLTWDASASQNGGTVYYTLYRSTDNVTFSNLATLTATGYLDTGLTQSQTYYYYITARDEAEATSSHSDTVSAKPEGKFTKAPNLNGQPEAHVRTRSADITWQTLNDSDRDGNIIPHPATSFVQYGATASYGNESGTSDLVSDHSVTLTGLNSNTTYHYRTKWVDVDGNQGLSSDATFTTLGAPSAPVNLAVDPTSGTTNSFTFTWQKANDEGVTVAGYRYSINSTPTESNVTAITDAQVGPIAAATRQGTNTFYVVAIDDGGNINYNNYGSIDFEAHTVPPTEPQNVTITDSSNRDQKRYSITLTWDPPVTNGNNVLYTINRSEDDGATYSVISTTRSTGYLDTGLNNTKKYTYRITASDSAGAVSAQTAAVAKIPEGRYTSPPAITKAPTATPDSFSAVITWSTERPASSFVDFGATADNLTEEQGTADMVSDHSVKITGLNATTLYYFSIKSIDVDQNVAHSDIASFTTLEAPRVMNVKISDIRLKDAIITWEVNKEATAIVNYGTTTNYGLTYTADSTNYSLKHTIKFENLNDGTTYHVRLGGFDRNGNPITSDDYQFTTLTFPKITDITTKNKSQGQTEIMWKTNVPTTSSVEYYGDSIAPKTQGNTTLVTDHDILLFGLNDDAQYKFKIHGSDQFGYEAVSTEQTFKTLQDTTPPEIFGIKSESNSVGSGETSKVQIVVSWKTNEASTSKVEYGVGISGDTFSSATDENQELVLDHLVVISDLAQAKTYHFRVVSRDKAGNQTRSSSNTVLTSQKQQSFLQLIVANLQNTFSWLGNIGTLLKK